LLQDLRMGMQWSIKSENNQRPLIFLLLPITSRRSIVSLHH
jgi:hypothetical protein